VLSPDEEVRTAACKMIIHLLDGTNDQVQAFIDRGCVRALSCLLSSTNPIVLNKLALDGLKRVVSLPEDIEICDNEVNMMECKLGDLERGINDEYTELTNMITSIREVVKVMIPDADNNLHQQHIQAAHQQPQRQQQQQSQRASSEGVSAGSQGTLSTSS